MRSAILTDIHANRQAFEAVLRDIAQRGADRLVFLGDLVGHGPDPDWVLSKIEDLLAHGAVAVRGNHDRYEPTPLSVLNPAARRVIDWTVNRLTARQRLMLADLPLMVDEGDTLFVHASADDPQNWAYVETAKDAQKCLKATQARVVFAGHIHRPALYSLNSRGEVALQDLGFDGAIPLGQTNRWLCQVGAVGPLRQADGAAQYCIYDSTARNVQFMRVGFDSAETARRARIVGMPLAAHLGR